MKWWHALVYLLICDLVHDVLCRQDVALTDAHKLHLERHRPVAGVEIEQSRVHVDAQEPRHVLHSCWLMRPPMR